MNFAGMVFEVLLCGVWWMVALGLWIYVLLGAPDQWSVLLARLLEGDVSLGASFALLLLFVTYGVGLAGRRAARLLYQDYRKWLTAVALHRAYAQSTSLDCPTGSRVENMENALRALTDQNWNGRMAGYLKEVRRFYNTRFAAAGACLFAGDKVPGVPLTKWRCLGSWRLCQDQKEALNRIRYASDVMRDYVLASDQNELQHDLMYHWRCMDAAQNTVLPVLGIGIALATMLAPSLESLILIILPGVIPMVVLMVKSRRPKLSDSCASVIDRIVRAIAAIAAIAVWAVMVGIPLYASLHGWVVSMWPALLAIVVTALVAYLLHLSVCAHSRYHDLAIFRGFHIAWAQRQERDRGRYSSRPRLLINRPRRGRRGHNRYD